MCNFVRNSGLFAGPRQPLQVLSALLNQRLASLLQQLPTYM